MLAGDGAELLVQLHNQGNDGMVPWILSVQVVPPGQWVSPTSFSWIILFFSFRIVFLITKKIFAQLGNCPFECTDHLILLARHWLLPLNFKPQKFVCDIYGENDVCTHTINPDLPFGRQNVNFNNQECEQD